LSEEYITKNFYFTGGTALSAFYLHHRYSEDLDFFSLQDFDRDRIEEIIYSWSKKFNFKYENKEREVVRMYLLHYEDVTLKLDFAHYPYPLIEEGFKYHDLKIDSLQDIATNKLLCIQSRTDVKDFVDLYYLLQDRNIWEISYGLEKKFRRIFEPLLYAEDMMKIQDFQELPRMIKPLTIEQLRSYYQELAKTLASKSIE